MPRKKKPKVTIAQIRTAVADYMRSEGCSCCRGATHDKHHDELGKLLGVKVVDGYRSFSKYQSR